MTLSHFKINLERKRYKATFTLNLTISKCNYVSSYILMGRFMFITKTKVHFDSWTVSQNRLKIRTNGHFNCLRMVLEFKVQPILSKYFHILNLNTQQ